MKSPFTPPELAEFRERLIERAREVRGNLQSLADESGPTEHVTATTNHPAEGASDSERQFIAAASAGQENDMLSQIERALRKIDTALPLPFGICEYSREPIDRSRLELLPWTPFSVEALNEMERR